MFWALTIIQSGLSLANIIIVQINYNKTKTWEKCGNFKGWMKSWLIMNYIGMAFKFCMVLKISDDI